MVTLILGILDRFAALSLFRAVTFGGIFAIVIGALVAIDAVAGDPRVSFWSLAVFGLSLWITYGLTIGGTHEDRGLRPVRRRGR